MKTKLFPNTQKFLCVGICIRRQQDKNMTCKLYMCRLNYKMEIQVILTSHNLSNLILRTVVLTYFENKLLPPNSSFYPISMAIPPANLSQITKTNKKIYIVFFFLNMNIKLDYIKRIPYQIKWVNIKSDSSKV